MRLPEEHALKTKPESTNPLSRKLDLGGISGILSARPPGRPDRIGNRGQGTGVGEGFEEKKIPMRSDPQRGSQKEKKPK